jgi:hypothetical protein
MASTFVQIQAQGFCDLDDATCEQIKYPMRC